MSGKLTETSVTLWEAISFLIEKFKYNSYLEHYFMEPHARNIHKKLIFTEKYRSYQKFETGYATIHFILNTQILCIKVRKVIFPVHYCVNL